MIPPLDQNGHLPPGIHEASAGEIGKRFGAFQGSDLRPQLWRRFGEFLREARAAGLFEAILLDGSFVTAKPDPGDIDLVGVVPADHDFSADLAPHRYNLIAARRVRRRFGFDRVVAKSGAESFAQATEFFAQVRGQPGRRKGLILIKL